jgi:integrase
VPKKARVLTKEQVEKFLVEAPDDYWLLYKVITIFGIFGACRCDELLSLTVKDVEDVENYIIVTLRNTKNLTTRRFTITDEVCSFQPCALYRKYAALRSRQAGQLRFFLTYRNGKCISLNVGQHTIGGVPKKIATYLGLQEPELYTGHSFRRSAATMVVDAGGDILTLKRAGGWKSSGIAEGYVDDSINKKIEIAKKMFPGRNSTDVASTSTNVASTSGGSTINCPMTSEFTSASEMFDISGNSNCTFNFNLYETKK